MHMFQTEPAPGVEGRNEDLAGSVLTHSERSGSFPVPSDSVLRLKERVKYGYFCPSFQQGYIRTSHQRHYTSCREFDLKPAVQRSETSD